MKARFINELHVTPLPDGKNWRLDADLKFMDSNGSLHIVHKGFNTDFASIPPLSTIAAIVLAFMIPLANLYPALWVVVGFAVWVCYIADSLCCDDQLDAPATIHDNGYQRKRFGAGAWIMKFYWDMVLLQALKAKRRPWWKRQLIYWNVTVFGWGAWWKDGKISRK